MHEHQFRRQAALYARHRPTYPRELFEYLTTVAPGRTCALDVGTGSGQAAVALAEHFATVPAIDPSAEQLAHAAAHPRVTYQVGGAERLPMVDGSVDLILAAQAAHWFELDAFFAEARRVLRPRGVVAICGYKFTRIAPEIDAVMDHLYHGVVGAYWSPLVRMVEREYRDIAFPFEELSAPRLWIEVRWTLAELEGYVMSWSATQNYIADRGGNPLDLVRGDLVRAWGAANAERLVRWPLSLRVGRI